MEDERYWVALENKNKNMHHKHSFCCRIESTSTKQIAFTILLATSIGDTVTQNSGHERGVANAVTVGQNNFFRK